MIEGPDAVRSALATDEAAFIAVAAQSAAVLIVIASDAVETAYINITGNVAAWWCVTHRQITNALADNTAEVAVIALEAAYVH